MKPERTILLVVPQHLGNPEQNPGGQITAANGLLDYIKRKGYAVKVLNTASPSFPKRPLPAKMLESARRVLAAIPILARKETDGAVLFTGAGLSLIERLFICMFCRLFGVRSVLFFRNSDILEIHGKGLKARLIGWACRLPDILAVQGTVWKELFVSIGVEPDRVAVIPNWLPSGFEIAQAPKKCVSGEEIHFVFVGWMTEEKGVRTLLDAIEQLLPRQNFRLTMVGGGTLEEEARQRVLTAGWTHVQVAGWKKLPDIKAILNDAHVFVLPTAHKEGFPNALLEAMSAGLAAISTHVGAIPDSLRDDENGLLVPGKNHEALANAMLTYLDSPGLVHVHSNETLRVVKERHNADLNCEKLLKALQGR